MSSFPGGDNGRVAVSLRAALRRRRATLALPFCSRFVNGKIRANDLHPAPEAYSIRPPRLLPSSFTILRPCPGRTTAELDPLSETVQFTSAPERLSSILISPDWLSNDACRAEFVINSWTSSPNRQQRSDSSRRASATNTRCIFMRSNLDRLTTMPIFRRYSAVSKETLGDRHSQGPVNIGMPVE
jgi:hypothetical protein